MTVNPAESTRSYSSRHNGDAIGTGHARSMLDSVQGWSTQDNSAGAWAQVDLGAVRSVSGVVTQKRRDADQYVKTLSVKTSTDGSTWTDVDGGAVFAANTAAQSYSAKTTITFSSAVQARYVKLFVLTYHNHMSMRFGVDAKSVSTWNPSTNSWSAC